MSSRSRSPLVVAAGLLAVAALGRATTGTDALMSAQVRNRGNAATVSSLGAPATMTAAPEGRDVRVQWPAAANATGYAVSRGQAAGASCSGVGVSPVATTAATQYLHAGAYQPQGSWFCYQVSSTAGSWTSVNANPVVPVQIGFVAATIRAASGGSPGALNTGDTITVTFNQAVNPASGPVATNTVCVTSANAPAARLHLGSTAVGGNCANTEAVSIGTVTGLGSNRNARFAATYSWSDGNRTLTVLLGNRVVGNGNPTISGAAVLAPTTTATALLSATGGHHVCDTNAGGGDCLPAVTGSI